jgi:hypothetical protein
MKYLGTFIRNIFLFLVTYTENGLSGDSAQRWEEKFLELKCFRIMFTSFITKLQDLTKHGLNVTEQCD